MDTPPAKSLRRFLLSLLAFPVSICEKRIDVATIYTFAAD